MLHQTARSRHKNFWVLAHLGGLLLKAGAATDGHGGDAGKGGQILDALTHLLGKLAGGSQDQAKGTGIGRWVIQKVLQHGNNKGERFAAAGFGAHDQILALQCRGQCRQLYGCRLGKAKFIDRLEQAVMQHQVSKHGFFSLEISCQHTSRKRVTELH